VEDFLRRHAVLLAAAWVLAGGATLWFVYARWSGAREEAARDLVVRPPADSVDPAFVERWRREGCAAGKAALCRDMGLEAQQGAGGAPPRLAEARVAFERACGLGDGWSCLTAGLMHERGQGTPRDFAQAASFFATSCDVRYAQGCQYLADEYAHGEGVPKDEARGRVLYTEAAGLHDKACAGGDIDSCHALGTMYRIGQGVPIDLALADRLTERACRGGLRQACPDP
jgi:TPR repeat protein